LLFSTVIGENTSVENSSQEAFSNSISDWTRDINPGKGKDLVASAGGKRRIHTGLRPRITICQGENKMFSL
jgi:hypothetical protein